MEHPNEIILTDETYPWMPTASRRFNVFLQHSNILFSWKWNLCKINPSSSQLVKAVTERGYEVCGD